MQDFVRLFKVLYKNQSAKPITQEGVKRKMSKKLALALAMLPLLAVFVAVIALITMSITDIKALSTLAVAVISAVQMMTLFMSMNSILTTLYGGKDIPFLSSLPIKSTSIFFAKFSIIYIDALKFSSVLIAPLLLTMTITFNVVNGAMFYGIYPIILLVLLVAPILPLFIVTLLSMPISFVGSYFKGRQTLKSVLTILLYIGIMAGYVGVTFYLQSQESGSGDDFALSQGALSSLTSFAKIMYPNKVLMDFAYGISAAKNFGIFVGILVAMVVLMLACALLFYKKINLKKVEARAGVEQRQVSFKQSSIISSLIKRDFSMIMRNSTLAMSSFANLLLAPIFIVMMYVMNLKPAQGEELTILAQNIMNMGFVAMYSVIFLAGANQLAAIAYTREGKSFFSSKALPIKSSDSIKAKLLLSITMPAILLLPIMILAIALYKIDFVSSMLIVAIVMLYVVGVCALHILFDMRKGNQHWQTASELKYSSKANTYQLISTFSAIIPACLAFVVGIILSIFCEYLGEVAIKAIFLSILAFFGIIICVVGLVLLKNYGEKYYEMIGENKPKIKQNRQKNMKVGGLLK